MKEQEEKEKEDKVTETEPREVGVQMEEKGGEEEITAKAHETA